MVWSMNRPKMPLFSSIFALAACAVLSSAPPVRADDVKDALDQAAKRRAELKAVQYVMVTTTRAGKETERTRQVIYEKRAGETWKSRTESFQQADGQGESKADAKPDLLTVFDGEHLWTEFRVEGAATIIKSKLRPDSPIDGIRNLAADGRARTKEVDLKDEKCWLVEIIEIKNRPIQKASYWVSRTHGMVLRSELTNSDGSSATAEVTRQKIDADLDDGLFAFKPAEGSTVMDVSEAK